MNIFRDIYRLGVVYHRRVQRARTERMISALPVDIRKDIGWPDSGTRTARVTHIREF
jgi:hypothetical protein